MKDTIFALATPVGGAIAIVRISGPMTRAVYSAVFSGECRHRYISPGLIMDGQAPVDQAMGVFFQSPASYTGEDMAELYIHGGTAVASRTLSMLEKSGLRPAAPGEFTQRAFLNGKLDLARAEAVMDLINAATDSAHSSALDQLRGSLSRRILEIQSRLTDLLSAIDAAIDYPEELDEDVTSSLPAGMAEALNELESLISSGMASRVIREGLRVAIMGRPNAGKSTLFNALLRQERAIVTSAPGTTRDVIDGEVIINGVLVRLLDTAGIREASDRAESIGIERAMEQAETADLILLALDPDAEPGEEERRILALPPKKLGVICKQDISQGRAARAFLEGSGLEWMAVSAVSGQGLDELMDRIAALPPQQESALITNSRHISALNRARDSILSAMEAGAEDLDCIATDLRSGLSALGEITGTDVDAGVLDRIFQRFCVGK